MSRSHSPSGSARFSFVRQGDRDGEPLGQLHVSPSTEKVGAYASDQDVATTTDGGTTMTTAEYDAFVVVLDASRGRPNLELNRRQDPFTAPSSSTMTSLSGGMPAAVVSRPILYHSAGNWAKAKRYFCSKVDMRYLYYQHFLNLQKVSAYQLAVLTRALQSAKRQSRIEDAIALSLFLHESSGLRTALDADAALFCKWHEGEFKGSLRARFGSERMLFKGYVDELHDHWAPLTSEELFRLPILRLLSKTAAEVMASPTHREVKDINQRTYFDTLVYRVDRDRGHTLY